MKVFDKNHYENEKCNEKTSRKKIFIKIFKNLLTKLFGCGIILKFAVKSESLSNFEKGRKNF